MGLLLDALEACGGMDQWHRLQRFTVHLSIDGTLFARKGKAGLLRNIVVEGRTKQQALQITGFTAPDRRGLYDPDRVAIERSDGELLEERKNPRAAFVGHTDQTPWDSLHLAYYCGCLIWNYLTAPFLLADSDFQTEELSSWQEDDETWRRLRVVFPPRIATHGSEQIFYFDRNGLQRRVDYEGAVLGGVQITQDFRAHQNFSGILVPTLGRSRWVRPDGTVIPTPVALDIEIFDAVFE
jgi:hypothetical protein